MTSYSIHLHDGTEPPKATHIDVLDDGAARDWALEWLIENPAYKHVSVAEGLRLIGKFARPQPTL